MRRLLSLVGRAEMTVAVFCLIVVVILAGAQALLRYAFGTSLWWAQEVAGTLVLVSYFLGASYIYKTRQFIIISFLSDLLPLAVQKVLYLFAQLMAIAFAASLAWLTWQFAPTLLGTRSATLGLSGILTGIPVGFAALMIVLTSVYYLAFGVWAFRRPGAGNSLLEIEQQGLILSPLEDIE